VINFASGLPDPRRIPYDIIHGIINEVYEKHTRESLSYPGALGIESLRENIPKFLEDLGISYRADLLPALKGEAFKRKVTIWLFCPRFYFHIFFDFRRLFNRLVVFYRTIFLRKTFE